VVTAGLENSTRAIWKLVILCTDASGLLHGILLARGFKVFWYDLIWVGFNTNSKKMTIGQDVCKFLAHTLRLGVCAPLKTLEQLPRFNGCTLGEVL
jgi:hypothetical protein